MNSNHSFWHSIKVRVTLLTVLIFVGSIWILQFAIGMTLRSEMEKLLQEQQVSTVSMAASELDEDFKMRIHALENISTEISPALMGDAPRLQVLLENRPTFQYLFNGGSFVTNTDGIAIASLPVALGRVGVNYADRDFHVSVIQEDRPVVSHAMQGKKLKAPIFVMATPIRDKQRKVIGVLSGTIDLSKPNFLSHMLHRGYGATGGYVVIDPVKRQIVTATDKSQMVRYVAHPGANALTDRVLMGYEGSGAMRTPEGVNVMTTSTRIPTAGWYIGILLPTDEALAPIEAMQRRMLLLTIFLTLLTGGLTWWWLRRQLTPMLDLSTRLRTLTHSKQPMSLLPVAQRNEVGELIRSFNALLESMWEKDASLQQSEARYRTLIEWTPEAIAVHGGGKLLYVNPAAVALFGATSAKDVLGRPILDFVPPGFQLLVLARIKMQAEQGVPVPLVEEKFLKLDGSVMDVEVQAAPITYEGKQAFQVAIRDITDRKKAKFALEESRARFQALSEASFEAIFISEKGKCLEQNSRAREMFGYSDAEAHGRPGTDWIAPENRDLVLKNMLSGYDLPYNVNGLRKDGTTFPSVIHGRTMHYKGAEVRVTSMRDVTEIRQAEEAMQQSTERLQSVVDAIPDLLFEMDLAGRYHAYFSPRTDLLIAPVQELIGKLIPDVMEPDAAAIVMAALQEANEREYSRGHVISLQTPIGQKWFELSIARKRTRANELPRFVVLSRDVTERKRSEQALLESEERFRSVMENIPGVAVQGYAMDGTVMFWNRAAEALYGYNADEALGGNLIDLIIPQEMHDGVREAMHSMAESGVAIPAGELLLKSKTGARIPVFSSHALLKPSSGEPELFCLDIDLTERKKLEEQVRQLAFYDALTQLPNRRLLDDRLTQVMAASRRTGFFGALMFLDLDNFKPLNDTQGHAVGDLLLMEVAKRLVSCVRESDTVARFGGDEFVVLIGELNISSSESNVQATAVAEKIRLILEKPFVLQIPEQGDKAAHTVEHHCSASIGVVLFKNPQDSQTDIVKKADWALYQAKSAGRNTVRFFALPDTSPA